ncbi:MAG TPA: hypothetical protein VLV48_01505 [Thermoanaerobaculia bacterium]|nr:hypothetical protein [Thermoanaerobaculia bacterium]
MHREPPEDIRDAVSSAARRIAHIAALALMAAAGPEPERGAAYLFDAQDVLRELRAVLKRG